MLHSQDLVVPDLQGAEEGDEEGDGEVDEEAVEEGEDDEVLAAGAGDDR